MRVLAALLLLLCGAARADDVRCPKGARTTLTIRQAERTELLRPDEAIGGDVLILRAGKQELLRTVSHDFHWLCLAYSSKRGHLVGSSAPMEGALVLRTIGYLAEDAETIEASAFTRDRFHAYAALASRDGRWVAFVGGRDDVALYVLDTLRDKVRKLGPAPVPPRGTSCGDWSCVEAFTAYGGWSFQNNALKVVQAVRGKKRQPRRYAL